MAWFYIFSSFFTRLVRFNIFMLNCSSPGTNTPTNCSKWHRNAIADLSKRPCRKLMGVSVVKILQRQKRLYYRPHPRGSSVKNYIEVLQHCVDAKSPVQIRVDPIKVWERNWLPLSWKDHKIVLDSHHANQSNGLKLLNGFKRQFRVCAAISSESC